MKAVPSDDGSRKHSLSPVVLIPVPLHLHVELPDKARKVAMFEMDGENLSCKVSDIADDKRCAGDVPGN